MHVEKCFLKKVDTVLCLWSSICMQISHTWFCSLLCRQWETTWWTMRPECATWNFSQACTSSPPCPLLRPWPWGLTCRVVSGRSNLCGWGVGGEGHLHFPSCLWPLVRLRGWVGASTPLWSVATAVCARWGEVGVYSFVGVCGHCFRCVTCISCWWSVTTAVHVIHLSTDLCPLFCVVSLPTELLPWCNHTGWLGVKHQVTYSYWSVCVLHLPNDLWPILRSIHLVICGHCSVCVRIIPGDVWPVLRGIHLRVIHGHCSVSVIYLPGDLWPLFRVMHLPGDICGHWSVCVPYSYTYIYTHTHP